jgi:hypothetical protein
LLLFPVRSEILVISESIKPVWILFQFWVQLRPRGGGRRAPRCALSQEVGAEFWVPFLYSAQCFVSLVPPQLTTYRKENAAQSQSQQKDFPQNRCFLSFLLRPEF